MAKGLAHTHRWARLSPHCRDPEAPSPQGRWLTLCTPLPPPSPAPAPRALLRYDSQVLVGLSGRVGGAAQHAARRGPHAAGPAAAPRHRQAPRSASVPPQPCSRPCAASGPLTGRRPCRCPPGTCRGAASGTRVPRGCRGRSPGCRRTATRGTRSLRRRADSVTHGATWRAQHPPLTGPVPGLWCPRRWGDSGRAPASSRAGPPTLATRARQGLRRQARPCPCRAIEPHPSMYLI